MIRSMSLLMLISDQIMHHSERYQYPEVRPVPIRLFELLEDHLADQLRERDPEELHQSVVLLKECVEKLGTEMYYSPDVEPGSINGSLPARDSGAETEDEEAA